MKFGKSLSNQIEETLPEWRDKFLSYKDLKKRLKLIAAPAPTGNNGGGDRPAKRPRLDPASDANGGGGGTPAAATGGPSATTTMTEEEEEEFMSLLEAELEKFNAFFLEKEEEYIIRLKELQDQVRMAKDSNKEDLLKVKKEIVDFHGEMVLLENYSALNYTGLVKILKKYDKITGALIRLPFIQKVLQQPFFTTDLLYKLVKECESMLDRLLPANKLSVAAATSATGDEIDDPVAREAGSSTLVGGDGGMPELEEIEYMESLYMKSTVSALRVLKEIRSGSSTVSVFSLPPLQGNGVEERWDKVTVLEQAAK